MDGLLFQIERLWVVVDSQSAKMDVIKSGNGRLRSKNVDGLIHDSQVLVVWIAQFNQHGPSNLTQGRLL